MNYSRELDLLEHNYGVTVKPLIREYLRLRAQSNLEHKKELIKILSEIKKIDNEYKEQVELHFQQWELETAEGLK